MLGAFVLAAVAATAHAQTKVLDSVAAVVDNDVVMKSELDERVDSILQRIEMSERNPPPREALVPQVLDRLILERIQLSMARRAGIRISDAELNQAIARVAERQGMTADQFVRQAEQEGLSVSTIKEQMMTEMMISRVQESQVNRRIFVSDQEIDNFLSSREGQAQTSPEVNLGHILLPLSSAASEQAIEDTMAQARDIIEQVRGGADFRNMAITHSADQTALQGGDLGWRRTTQLPEVFIPVVRAMQAGEISEPVRSDAGIHLLKLYERRGGEKQVINQSKVRHILLKPNEIRDDAATREELARIAERIRSGEASFAEMAKEHSEDIGSALSGGELGWSMPGKFVPAFEQTVDALDEGEISQPFRSQFGWHIVQVTERRDQDFSEEIRRARAEQVLRQRKFEEELQVWQQEIRDKAYVDVKI